MPGVSDMYAIHYANLQQPGMRPCQNYYYCGHYQVVSAEVWPMVLAARHLILQISEKQYCQKVEHVIKSASKANLPLAGEDGGGGDDSNSCGEAVTSAAVVVMAAPDDADKVAASTEEDGFGAGTLRDPSKE
jgi:hypothetical protein